MIEDFVIRGEDAGRIAIPGSWSRVQVQMKRVATFALLIILTLVCAVPGYGRTRKTRNMYGGQTRASRKAQKREAKAMKKYAKAQRKAQRKMLKTERKHTTYKPRKNF
jgi:hypothetical protein